MNPLRRPDLKDLIVRRVFSEGEAPDLSRFLHFASRRTRSLAHEWAVYARERGAGAGIIPLMVVQVPRPPEREGFADVVQDISEIIREEWPGMSGADSIVHVIPNCEAPDVPLVDVDRVQGDTSIRVVIIDEVSGREWWPRAGVVVTFRNPSDVSVIAALLERLMPLPLGERVPGGDYLNGLETYAPLLDWATAREVAQQVLPGDKLAERVTSTVVVDTEREVPVQQPIADDGEEDDEGRDFLSEKLEDEDDDPTTEEVSKPDPSRMRWDHEVRQVPPPPPERDKGKKKPLVYERSNERGTQGGVKPPPVVPTHPAYASGLAYFDDRWPKRLEQERLDALYPPRPAPIPLTVVRAYRSDPRVSFDPIRTEFSLFAHGGVWEAYDLLSSDRSEEGRVVQYPLARPHTRSAERYVVSEDGQRLTLPTYPNHLTADEGGVFPVSMSGLETRLMMKWARKDNYAAWYSNPEAHRPESLSMPTPQGRVIAPTFLFFTATPSGRMTVSLVDVSDFHAPDALDRLRGLANYAARHERLFAGMESFWRVEQEPVGIDLSAPVVRAAIERAESAEEVYRTKGYLVG